MGIPGLIGILKRMNMFRGAFVDMQDAEAAQKLPEYAVDGRYEYMCFDLPGLIHERTRRVNLMGEYANLQPILIEHSERELINTVALQVVDAIAHNIYMANPEHVVIAMDGPVPTAKMKQQRERRFKSSTPEGFDTNQITAGTPYMVGLEKAIVTELTNRVKANKLPHIEFFGQASYGEGEHKIMAFLREKANRKRTQLIFGADTDLIILSLMLPTQVVLRREGFHTHVLVHEMRAAMNQAHIPIHDWCVLISFIGNDFIPHHDITTDKDLTENMVKFIFKHLEENYENDYGRIVESDEGHYVINWKTMADFVSELADNEREWLVEFSRKVRAQKNNSFVYGSSFTDGITVAFINNWYKRELFHGNSKPQGIGITKNRLAHNLPNILTETKNDMCRHVMIGLQWILSYYTGENVHPYWQYPYSYFPMFGTLADYVHDNADNYYNIHLDIIQDSNDGIHTLVHRLCVLPHWSWDLCLSRREKKKLNSSIGVENYYLFPSGATTSSKDLPAKKNMKKTYYDEINYTQEYSMGIPEMYVRVFVPHIDPRDVVKMLKYKERIPYVEHLTSLFPASDTAYQNYQRRQLRIIIKDLQANKERLESAQTDERGHSDRRDRRDRAGKPKPTTQTKARDRDRAGKSKPTTRVKDVDRLTLYDRDVVLDIPKQ